MSPPALPEDQSVSNTHYRLTARRLSREEGRVRLVEYPGLPDCTSDGETIEDAIANAEDAKRCWIFGHERSEQANPAALSQASGGVRRYMRAPRDEVADRQLAERTKREGGSLFRTSALLQLTVRD